MITIFKNKIELTLNGKTLKIPENKLMFYLTEPVAIDHGVTFERIMKIFNKEHLMINIIFGATMGNYKIQQYYKDMMGRSENFCDPKKEYLEVYSYPDIWKLYKNKPCEFNMISDIHIRKKGSDTPFGLSFLKLSNIRHLNVTINGEIKFCIQDTTIKSKTREAMLKSYEPILKAELTHFRLFDFINAILYEISWHGSPEERDERSEKLSNTVKRIESGEEKLIKHESLEAALKTLKKRKKPTNKKSSTLRG